MKRIVNKLTEVNFVELSKLPPGGIIVSIWQKQMAILTQDRIFSTEGGPKWFFQRPNFNNSDIHSLSNTMQESIEKNVDVEGVDIYWFENVQDLAFAIRKNGWE